MKIQFMAVQHSNGVTLHRIRTPMKYLELNLHECRYTYRSDEVDPDWCDVLFISQTTSDHLVGLAQYIQGRGGVVILDEDDYSMHVLDREGRGEAAKSLMELEPLVSAVCTTNDHLGELFTNDRYFVIPNMLDNEKWFPRQREWKIAPTLGWFGGNTHKEDLRVLVDPIKRILSEFPFVKMVYAESRKGTDPERDMSWFAGVHENIVPLMPAPAERYHELFQQVDIGLAPLAVDDVFTRSKSDLKALEYAGCGTPCVASHVRPYVESKAITAKTQDDWYEEIRALITDPHHYHARSAIATDWAKSRMMWDNVTMYEEMFSTLLGEGGTCQSK